MMTNMNIPSLATAMTGNARTGTAAAASSASTTREAEFQGLTITDFYKLLAVQMQYQDMDNPMDTSQMMTQMVQSQLSQAINQMSSAVSELSMVNLISYASSMMGREVTLAEVDDKGEYTGAETKGVVTGVRLGATPTVVVNGKEYYLAQIMSVGQVPKAPEGESVPGEDSDQKVEGSDGAQGDGSVSGDGNVNADDNVSEDGNVNVDGNLSGDSNSGGDAEGQGGDPEPQGSLTGNV